MRQAQRAASPPTEAPAVPVLYCNMKARVKDNFAHGPIVAFAAFVVWVLAKSYWPVYNQEKLYFQNKMRYSLVKQPNAVM
ncbi:MAG: hypothetical protein L5657_04645, partial [Calditerricola sp.]|nr:hypothetical protein [Calditerricola sp.]